MKFYAANLTIGSDLSVNFYLKGDEAIADSSFLRCYLYLVWLGVVVYCLLKAAILNNNHNRHLLLRRKALPKRKRVHSSSFLLSILLSILETWMMKTSLLIRHFHRFNAKAHHSAIIKKIKAHVVAHALFLYTNNIKRYFAENHAIVGRFGKKLPTSRTGILSGFTRLFRGATLSFRHPFYHSERSEESQKR